MQFELTDALIDDIVFTMENQEWVSYLDTIEGVVVGEDLLEFGTIANDTEDRYIDLPDWDSSEGFNLMEQFAAGFKNKLIRTKLSSALNRGRGVFRAFKDTLAGYPEAEKLWFAYKDKEMKRAVIRWYNALREEWGLERIGEEPEETEDLVQEDFRFRPATAADTDKVKELRQLCCAESPSLRSLLQWSFPGRLETTFTADCTLVAETGGVDFAAYISWAVTGKTAAVIALEVRPEYRGLGVGEALLTRFLKIADAKGIAEILIDIPQEADGFSRVLLRESFNPCLTRYRRTP
jgi:GNAT superfamily N-acetyltransferase